MTPAERTSLILAAGGVAIALLFGLWDMWRLARSRRKAQRDWWAEVRRNQQVAQRDVEQPRVHGGVL